MKMKVGDNMLKYKLICKNETEIMYEYFPEGNNISGIIVYNIELNDCVIQKLAENDRHSLYALKMIKRIQEFANNCSFLESGIVAWY